MLVFCEPHLWSLPHILCYNLPEVYELFLAQGQNRVPIPAPKASHGGQFITQKRLLEKICLSALATQPAGVHSE